MKGHALFLGALKLSSVTLLAVVIATPSFEGLLTPSCAQPSTERSSASDEIEPFFPGEAYLESVPSPEAFLGYPIGSKAVGHDGALRYLNHLAETSPRVQFIEFGRSHEGRMLFCVIISSESNISRLDEIKASVGRLADPRKLTGKKEAESIIKDTPAVCWLGYSIHGDELSSTDCALQVAYQLAAGTDTLTERLLRELVVLVDPIQNPDGRERYLAQMRQVAGAVPNPDHQSLQHRGFWPGGRSNHYLFDLNRDWFALVQPETRAMVQEVLEWHPQLFVDSHEMGPLNTYLFSPPREPFNPNVTDRQKRWWTLFARDQADGFDQYGWSYYTREWCEEWYPGYANGWAMHIGAIGILYEQAGVDGSLVRQRDGSLLTYRESIHHHFVSSIANLTTAAVRRTDLLRQYYEEKVRAVEERPSRHPRAFLFVPGLKSMRTADLIERLIRQQIEVHVAASGFTARDLHDCWGHSFSEKRVPAGTYIVPLDQPMRHLILAILEFDPRMTEAFLTNERRNLEKKEETSIYDVTAWSLPMAYDLDAYWTNRPVAAEMKAVTEPEVPLGRMEEPNIRYGWVIHSKEDGVVPALIMLFQEGYTVRAAEEPFAIEGIAFPKGSILLRRRENPDRLPDFLGKVADETGVTVYGVNTALSEEGPDLGGHRFHLLEVPRIGVLTGMPISTTSYGAVWHLLDREYEFRFSSLDIGSVARMDVDKYNVLVLPDVWGGGEAYSEIMGDRGIKKLKTWIEGGGTLVAIGSAAAFAADTSVGLSGVRLRRQVLDEIEGYTEAVARERAAEATVVDSVALWEVGKEKKKTGPKATGEDSKSSAESRSAKELASEDAHRRVFMPRGCILRADLDGKHWLTAGMDEKVPVILYTSYALLSKRPIETAARLAEPDSLRLSGLLWPEARARWASTAYLTREQLGKGQIILFAGDPVFRGYFRGSQRLLTNALLLGPGFGTSRPTPW